MPPPSLPTRGTTKKHPRGLLEKDLIHGELEELVKQHVGSWLILSRINVKVDMVRLEQFRETVPDSSGMIIGGYQDEGLITTVRDNVRDGPCL